MTWDSSSFMSGFSKSFGVILASEIGDRTFFIAAILAMTNPRMSVFAGSICALGTMTILSALMGLAAPNLVPKIYTYYATITLFFLFGFKTLYDVYFGGSADENSELAEVEEEINSDVTTPLVDSEAAVDSKKKSFSDTMHSVASVLFSEIFIKAFSMNFLAEWGDRSQIATISLASSENVFGVIIGGILGHSICTGAAVVGGRHLAAHINGKTVAIISGCVFIAFGALSIYMGPDA
eukprot:CAMPEP_0175067528 /NCGR_PEP_ID=MMETSP0052_2-20121109/17153_1 /TAXON_ID=51329 ORGANISM="Polytomella parva, Strain SAG 63-3" /NCGR_SAMPLE_ID=MMETSP0052_2 /ASSEMBLY_ACC=CAM_ASM_000194 /LENGTH=236 /DNA_ID=CAMNT_0016334429 /DNA_START=126 /DNA_END=836 /DNA_ORIENTATION=+